MTQHPRSPRRDRRPLARPPDRARVNDHEIIVAKVAGVPAGARHRLEGAAY